MLPRLTAMTRSIRSAGCLIIGDEVLNGKILDTNLFEFAKFCFNELSVPLKKTIVCGDDTEDIIQSLEILRQNKCDFIVTSGGIGSTHDDITYEALSLAFHLQCLLDSETVDKMHALRGPYLLLLSKSQLDSFYRMATLPQASDDVSVLKLFTDESLWVPIVGINEQVYVLPGVPQLFKKLLTGLGASLKDRVKPEKFTRFFVQTTTGESSLAPFLSDLQNHCNTIHGPGKIKLGSYPHFNWKINTISIIGDSSVSSGDLRLVVDKVIKNVGENAKEITLQEEEYMTTNEPQP
ncbi:Molybdopterin binding protein [Metschnikowia bicuspidata var. bicuspidata NRRL YB-4993]|uniref:Molybdopterin binding protein n=1 Tax=Metschnikowia bicuspidata var. bicuspidata NRRL YB-4993 TaxID=869754 RepID=A0A1A0H4R7_9ASCO|nr:Molybdopterin binding protein [Metschnikowia bicuspidata var. bicuspidata NRRL YB-4993]OBA19031.1 Molybdopterin binding protein [Metschnikowia bicuspidata var. bicuspidata NRRL YB-4993]